MRMKCTVTTRGRTVNLKSASWKVRELSFWIFWHQDRPPVCVFFIATVFHVCIVGFSRKVASSQESLYSGRCCIALDNWKCTTAAHQGACAASGSLLSPALSWCVNPSHTHPTSTNRWTAGPSSADTAWTWSSPTVTRGKPRGAHMAALSMSRVGSVARYPTANDASQQSSEAGAAHSVGAVGSQSSRTELRVLLVSGLLFRCDKRWKMLHLDHLGAFSHSLSLFLRNHSSYSDRNQEVTCALDKSHLLFCGLFVVCKILNLPNFLKFFGIGLKGQTHTLIKLHKCTHVGFLSSCSSRTKVCFLGGGDHWFGLCMQMSV